MATPQIRLDDEVAQALQRRAIDSGRSLSAEGNAWLRRALGLTPGAHSPAALAHPAPGAQPATISAAKGQAPLRASGVVGRARPR